MPRFSVYLGATLVGWSDLESGDPPMGVAFGRFIPAPAYSQFRADVAAQRDLASGFTVVESGGERIESAGGAHITDHGDEENIELTVLGVVHPSYLSLFPDHVAAYERQFHRDG